LNGEKQVKIVVETNENNSKTLNVSLTFKNITLPPFQDILILARKCPHGTKGIFGCFQLLSPDQFELIEPDDPKIEALLVNKRLLKRMPITTIIELLQQRVFPYIDTGEMVKVDLDITTQIDNIKIST
jgi:hypothetical protein